jgi:hypothetical protein
MENLSVSTIENNTIKFADYVSLKRKMFWAKRYVTIANNRLIYYA